MAKERVFKRKVVIDWRGLPEGRLVASALVGAP
jgi:hypothetical protein